MEDYGYVIKNSDNMYFTGYGGVSTQLHEARIYYSVGYAFDRINELRTNHRKLFSNIKRDFRLVKIKIQEIEHEV